MNYRAEERRKAIKTRDRLFRDPGGGIFSRKEREFVLKDAVLNLWEGIRMDAQDYFERNEIAWWMGDENNKPTGHLLSSQVACLNHLYPIRQRKDLATAVLKNINRNVEEAVIVDDGHVEFEVAGKQNYLNERSHTRGANCTSIDALMVGKKADGKNILFMIEWKYTEEYRQESKYIHHRYEIYNKLLSEDNCPIVIDDYKALYYEPFYQLMRQTLLGWKMVENGEYSCDEYVHLHIIPNKNKELLERVTSPGLSGETISDAWRNVLKDKDRYIVISPRDFISPVQACPDTKSIIIYLRERYWV